MYHRLNDAALAPSLARGRFVDNHSAISCSVAVRSHLREQLRKALEMRCAHVLQQADDKLLAKVAERNKLRYAVRFRAACFVNDLFPVFLLRIKRVKLPKVWYSCFSPCWERSLRRNQGWLRIAIDCEFGQANLTSERAHQARLTI